MSSEPAGQVATKRLESSRYRAVLELAALDKSDFSDVLRRILATDARELDLERVNCWSFEERRIVCVEGYLRSSNSFESGAIIEATSCPSYFRALADDPVILADDARTDPRTREFRDGYLVPNGITSMMDVPVWVRGRLWGVICHEHIGPARHWTEEDRDFAISIGHIVSMAVEASERADAERTARFSEFFIGVLSHDLRSPLATIRMAADLMRARDNDVTRRTSTQQILRNAKLMDRMIEQLLDFTRIRVGGGMPIDRTEVDLAELARQLVADLPPDLVNRVDIGASGFTNGFFDVDRIWQAFSNLIGNALDHGSSGGRVRVVIDGLDAYKVVVQVTNQGAISDSMMRVLFDPFQRAQTRVTERKNGLGLGLFIVREIAAAHNGTISVTSEANEVMFTLMLPRREPVARR
jgi:signal transduction histidine kinase